MGKQENRTHTAAKAPQHEITLRALGCGGFVIMNGRGSDDSDPRQMFRDHIAAFTTLDETLAWLRSNMAQPGTAAAKP